MTKQCCYSLNRRFSQASGMFPMGLLFITVLPKETHQQSFTTFPLFLITKLRNNKSIQIR